MVRIIQGKAKIGVTVFCDLELSLAVEWCGSQDPRKFCKGAVIDELFHGRRVLGCRTAGELIEKYRAAHPAAG